MVRRPEQPAGRSISARYHSLHRSDRNLHRRRELLGEYDAVCGSCCTPTQSHGRCDRRSARRGDVAADRYPGDGYAADTDDEPHGDARAYGRAHNCAIYSCPSDGDRSAAHCCADRGSCSAAHSPSAGANVCADRRAPGTCARGDRSIHGNNRATTVHPARYCHHARWNRGCPNNRSRYLPAGNRCNGYCCHGSPGVNGRSRPFASHSSGNRHHTAGSNAGRSDRSSGDGSDGGATANRGTGELQRALTLRSFTERLCR